MRELTEKCRLSARGAARLFLCSKYEKQHLTQARGLHVFTSGEEEPTASTFSSIVTNNRVIVVLDFLIRRMLTVCVLQADVADVADVAEVLRTRANVFAASRMPLYITGVDCGVNAGVDCVDVDKKRKRATALTA